MEKEKNNKVLIIFLVAIIFVLACIVVFLLLDKKVIKQENTTRKTTIPITNTYEGELRDLKIYEYLSCNYSGSGRFGIENWDDDCIKLVKTIKAINYNQGDDVLIAFDGIKFYFADLTFNELILEELTYNKTYKLDSMNIKIDVYSKGKYNAYVINNNSISHDYRGNAGAGIERDGKYYFISFDLATLEDGYLAVIEDDNTKIYNIDNGEEVFSKTGECSFYEYDAGSYAFVSYKKEDDLEGLIYTKVTDIHNKEFRLIDSFEAIIYLEN